MGLNITPLPPAGDKKRQARQYGSGSREPHSNFAAVLAQYHVNGRSFVPQQKKDGFAGEAIPLRDIQQSDITRLRREISTTNEKIKTLLS